MSIVRYGIVIETGLANCSAYVPDLPGCIATGSTVAEVKKRMRAAIRIHLEGLREDGDSPPVPTTVCDWVEVA